MTVPLARPSSARLPEVFDLLLVALGYEERSSHLARSARLVAKRHHAIGFESHHVLSFDENRRFLEDEGYSIDFAGDQSFPELAQQVVASVLEQQDEEPLNIAVDISSFSRIRLAYLIEAFHAANWGVTVNVFFFYTLAEFSPPPEGAKPNKHVGPVIPYFAGWTDDPDAPVTTILGLGYEEERALGAVEQVQGGQSWLFLPRSPIEAYEGEVKKANRLLLESTGGEALLTYSVLDPFHTFVVLEALAHRSLRAGGGMIFPFGPKIFTVVALVVGLIHRDVAVWRVSPGDLQLPQQRLPSRYITHFRMQLGRDQDAPRERESDGGVVETVS